MFEQLNNNNRQMWECKECHHLVAEEQTVAYHLVDRILYGWCESCFDQRERDSLVA
jgi:hypothetical protein